MQKLEAESHSYKMGMSILFLRKRSRLSGVHMHMESIVDHMLFLAPRYVSVFKRVTVRHG